VTHFYDQEAGVIHVSMTEELVRRSVDELPPPQREVIKLRYGLNGSRDPLPLQRVAHELDMAPKDVRRFEEQGLRAGDILQQVGRDAVETPKDAVSKLKEAKDSKKPVLMKVYREGSTRFVAVSPRAA